LGEFDSCHFTGRVFDTATAKIADDDAGSPCRRVPIELEWCWEFRRHEDAWLARNP
jgi:hypothetical protein